MSRLTQSTLRLRALRCAPMLALTAALSACAAEGEGDEPLETPDGGWPSLVDGATSYPEAGTYYDAGSFDAGGSVAGGGTPGGGTPGGDTAGGTTAGGTTAGGFTAGGFLAGGLPSGLTGGSTAGGSPGGGTPGGTPIDPSVRKPPADKLPTVKGSCPDLKDGTITVAGSRVKIWAGSKPGPVYFYFHGTGSTPDEVNQGLPGVTAATKSAGGLVVSWDQSNKTGASTGSAWAVWYTGDFDAADQLLACAIEKGIADTGRVHVAGYSAGGLQTGAMLFMRSAYIASGIVYSGGKGFGAMGFQDAGHIPAILGAHGAKGSDTLILDFSDNTQQVERAIKSAGGFAMDCDDGGGHVQLSRLGVGGKAVQFLADHPYNTKPSPYAGGLPTGFPAFCKVVQ